MDSTALKRKILNYNANDVAFYDLARAVYNYQLENNPIFGQYAKLTQATESGFSFMPISFFKSNKIQTGIWEPKQIFESSGTTGENTSKHFLRDEDWYQQVSSQIFESQYGPLKDRPILALLPSYLERDNSSLVYMVNHFMKLSGHPSNAFYLDDFEALFEQLLDLKSEEANGLLVGVSFALLDFQAQFPLSLEDWIIMETGGMKGRKEDMLRTDLHAQLNKGFNQSNIHSEYGMTELLSQAYSQSEGVFDMNPYFRVMIRAIDDPNQIVEDGKLGTVCIIDLANVDSCSFIATQDLGRRINENQFTIEGRIEQADLRGCNLLYN